jgi:hypothetical protein
VNHAVPRKLDAPSMDTIAPREVAAWARPQQWEKPAPRRYGEPMPCERPISEAEFELMQAMHEYKQSSGRMFPTWSEVLEVVRSLGYQKGG